MKVVRLDVGNYCDGWAVTQQGGIGLIGCGQLNRAGTNAHAGTGAAFVAEAEATLRRAS